MITDARIDRLVVISDLHLGNPFSSSKKKTIEFLRWASQEGYDVCINGDGFEIAQISFQKLSQDVPEVLHEIRSLVNHGGKIYYIVGNHDILLENFLEDWGGFNVSSYLNVLSGSSRIRIEHGHLHDSFFINFPTLYEFCAWLSGFFLRLYPKLYQLFISYERLKSSLLMAKHQGIVGEHPNYFLAARELIQRGFDAVIFGHTHHAGEVELRHGKRYLNTGSWLLDTHYVEINHGEISLKTWKA